MSGLFEDDSNVRKIKKLPTEKKPVSKKLKDIGITTVKSNFKAPKSIGTKGKSFDKIDLDKASINSEKQETGRIVPAIDYVSDNNG